jgi:hypothetical protein
MRSFQAGSRDRGSPLPDAALPPGPAPLRAAAASAKRVIDLVSDDEEELKQQGERSVRARGSPGSAPAALPAAAVQQPLQQQPGPGPGLGPAAAAPAAARGELQSGAPVRCALSDQPLTRPVVLVLRGEPGAAVSPPMERSAAREHVYGALLRALQQQQPGLRTPLQLQQALDAVSDAAGQQTFRFTVPVGGGRTMEVSAFYACNMMVLEAPWAAAAGARAPPADQPAGGAARVMPAWDLVVFDQPTQRVLLFLEPWAAPAGSAASDAQRAAYLTLRGVPACDSPLDEPRAPLPASSHAEAARSIRQAAGAGLSEYGWRRYAFLLQAGQPHEQALAEALAEGEGLQAQQGRGLQPGLPGQPQQGQQGQQQQAAGSKQQAAGSKQQVGRGPGAGPARTLGRSMSEPALAHEVIDVDNPPPRRRASSVTQTLLAGLPPQGQPRARRRSPAPRARQAGEPLLVAGKGNVPNAAGGAQPLPGLPPYSSVAEGRKVGVTVSQQQNELFRRDDIQGMEPYKVFTVSSGGPPAPCYLCVELAGDKSAKEITAGVVAIHHWMRDGNGGFQFTVKGLCEECEGMVRRGCDALEWAAAPQGPRGG